MMKKILSLVLAIAVLSVGFTSFVSAATLQDAGDGLYLIDGVVASPALATPTLNIAVTQAAAKAEISDYCKNAIDANGFNFSTQDVYKIDFILSNLGELVNGYTTSFDPIISGIAQVTITVPSTTFAKSSTKAAQVEGGTNACGTDQETGDFAVTWNVATVENPYPVFNTEGTESRYIANGTMTFTIVAALTKGATLDVSNVSTVISYIDQNLVTTVNSNAANATLKLPATDPVIKITTAETKTNFGTATTDLKDRAGEDVTLTKNYGITKFSPTLNTATKKYFINAKDTSGNEMGKTAINFAAQRIEGKATFYVIVKSAEHVISDIWIEEEDAE